MYNIVVFVMVLGVSLANNCGDAPDTNGCNAWDIVPYKNKFAPACNKHDVCYSCGDTFDVSLSRCNEAFLDDMYGICDGGWFCRSWAKIYYKAVDMFGHGYKRPSHSWCRQETWFRTECMP